MLEYLANKPFIGVISGFGSGAIALVQSTVNDPKQINMVAEVGMYAGAFVAIITGVLKLIELIDTLKKRWNG